jgi:hypothetical protein
VETFWRRPRSRVSDQENGGVANIGELAIAGEVAISTAAERSEEDFLSDVRDPEQIYQLFLPSSCVRGTAPLAVSATGDRYPDLRTAAVRTSVPALAKGAGRSKHAARVVHTSEE